MCSITLTYLNLRTNYENALAISETFINKHPDFQREYEEWSDRLKTKFMESILIGRAMNPIWTILNPDDNSEEILDGMHRVTTALDFLNNKYPLCAKYFTDSRFKKYDKKYFRDLDLDDQSRIRNYSFIFNNLDSSYRTDLNKRRDMYEILNRSSKTLNDFEFNKVSYNKLYDLIIPFKNDLNILFNKKDSRGAIETEILDILVLSDVLQKSWSSITSLRNKYLNSKIGTDEQEIENYLEDNAENIRYKLELTVKIVEYFNYKNIIPSDKKERSKQYVPLKFFISRIIFKLKNISVFNRCISRILKIWIDEIVVEDIQLKLNCRTRNATFQRKLINTIDDIIDNIWDPHDPLNRRLFSKKQTAEKILEQENKCALCEIKLKRKYYEADHIIPWCQGGQTSLENLQILCKECHIQKSN
jgi:hypothetical protein